MLLSLSNRNSARARANSVLPTPVGPRKINDPIGRCGSLSPERARMTASAVAWTASSWPMTLLAEVQQLLHLAFEQLRRRNPRPSANNFGDIFLVDLFLD